MDCFSLALGFGKSEQGDGNREAEGNSSDYGRFLENVWKELLLPIRLREL